MAAAELLDLMEKPEYVGKTDVELLAILNEWHPDNVPCSSKACRKKLDEMLVLERADTALMKGDIGDVTRAGVQHWYMLTERLPHIDFERDGINFLIPKLTFLVAPEPTWLLDLGRRLWTLGRKAMARDVVLEDFAKARDLKPLRDSIAAQRIAVQAKFEADMAAVQAAHDELQKTGTGGSIAGDKNYKPSWVK